MCQDWPPLPQVSFTVAFPGVATAEADAATTSVAADYCCCYSDLHFDYFDAKFKMLHQEPLYYHQHLLPQYAKEKLSPIATAPKNWKVHDCPPAKKALQLR